MKKNTVPGNMICLIMLPLVFTKDTTPEDFAKSVDQEFENMKKGLVNPETLKGEIEKGLETVISAAVTKQTETLQGTVTTLEKSVKDAEEIAIKQGEAITALKANGGSEGNGLEVAKHMKVQLEKLFESSEKNATTEKTVVKVADSADTAIAVNAHNSIPGAIGAVGNYFAQLIPGFARKPVPKSNILDYVDVMPLNADRLVSIAQTETVSILVTPECEVKPKSTVVWAAIDAAAEAVATTWKTTTKMRRFFPMFVTAFMNTLKDYFAKKIPQLIIAQIAANATSFTPVTAQQTQTDPNNWDALIALIASLVKLGFAPNVAKMSVFAWEAMLTQKASDGHYMLQNNGSINLLEKTISFGDVVVAIEPDVEFTDDQVMVGDLSAVKVGLDNNLTYMEYFSGDDGDKNLKSHLLEKFIAIIIPTPLRAGIIMDTFSNVKSLITAEAP